MSPCRRGREADPLNLAPTSSTTLQLALGDALAGMVTELRGLCQEDFALFHPGGALGRKLLLRVEDLMGSGERLPRVERGATVSEALFEMTSKGYGATAVTDEEGFLVGIFTDGDLRRFLERSLHPSMDAPIEEAMTVSRGPRQTASPPRRRTLMGAMKSPSSWRCVGKPWGSSARTPQSGPGLTWARARSRSVVAGALRPAGPGVHATWEPPPAAVR